jgi:hypothetical protein
MKTKHPTPTRSKSARHNGRADNDTNKPTKYQVAFSYAQRGLRIIEARTPAEAREKAKHISVLQKNFWQDMPEAYTVEEIFPLGSNEIPRDVLEVKTPDQPQSES